MFTVYVLKSSINGKLYIGYSRDINKRIADHNRGKTRSTKAYAPYSLVHKEIYKNKTEAIKREIFLKSGQGRKFLKSVVASL
jgi:putative endonuclease